MSRRNKLQKFTELLRFPNVYENYNAQEPKLVGKNGAEVGLKGKWASDHFQNDHPITLELACGKGHYTLGLARVSGQQNFIGVDIKGARIWKGAKIALEEGLENVAFLRTRIEQIALFFAPEEVSEIWITFPDPFLRNTKANRRLTAPPFIEQYRKILKSNGIVHLKTDSPELFAYTLEVIKQDPRIQIEYQEEDIYSKPLQYPALEIKTYYEKMHLANGRKIKYLRFKI